MRVNDLSWFDIAEYLRSDDRVILPLGATEEHGPHLGLGTDTLEATAIAEQAGEIAQVPVVPTMPFGMSESLMGFPGTLSLKPETLIRVLCDILTALHRHGFRRVLIVNGHGGNTPCLSAAVQTVAESLPGLRVKNFQWWTDAEAYSIVTREMGVQQGSHAADGETAFMLAIRPQAVHIERLTGHDAPANESRELGTIHNFAMQFPDGIMGNHPGHATAEAGKKILAKSVEICVRELGKW
jgi:creatinine amidohydrolase